MTTIIRDIRPDAVLQCVSDFLQGRGFVMDAEDKLELSARMKGYATAADCAGFEARESKFRAVKLDARDVTSGGLVVRPKYSLEGPVLASFDKAGLAYDWAENCAIDLKVPVIVCDDNGNVRATFDEEVSPDAGYSVTLSVGKVRDEQAAEARNVAEDVDLVDAGYLTLRGAFTCFNATLKRLRELGVQTGSVLFIQNYEGEGEGEGELIVHRAIV